MLGRKIKQGEQYGSSMGVVRNGGSQRRAERQLGE